MRVIDIVPGTSVDGPGLRTAIYFAGCSHECPGCHNPQSWDFHAGREMSASEIAGIVADNGFDVTFTGGDPLYQGDDLIELAREIRGGGKSIWCYTGFLYEEVCASEKMRRILDYVEVLVDGPYIESMRDIALLFRGSANQRLIDVARSTPDRPVIWGESFTELSF